MGKRNSGSSANLLVIAGLLYSDRLKNNKIIVPAVSWVTTVSPSIMLGLEPILCDADQDNLGLSVRDFESLCIEHNPAAVMLVHVLGHPNHRWLQLKEAWYVLMTMNFIMPCYLFALMAGSEIMTKTLEKDFLISMTCMMNLILNIFLFIRV